MLLLADAMVGGRKVPPLAAAAAEMLASVPPDWKPCNNAWLETEAAVNALPGTPGAILRPSILKLATKGGLLTKRSMICPGYRSEKTRVAAGRARLVGVSVGTQRKGQLQLCRCTPHVLGV